MPRKAFIADLQGAASQFERPNVSNIKAGEDDGQVCFQYEHQACITEVVALVPDLGEYPESHSYMFFTNSENVVPAIHNAVDTMPDCSNLKVSEMLAKVVKIIDKAVSGSRTNPTNLGKGADDPMIIDSASGSEPEEDEAEEADYDSDDEAWSSKPAKAQWTNASNVKPMTPDQKVVKARLRHDLRLAKNAGFRVAQVGDLANGGRDGFVTLSIRVSKLGISEEALDAWHMDPTQYFLVLLRYTAGYQSYDQLIGSGPCNTRIRVGLTHQYKIAIDEAVEAFAQLEDKSKSNKLFTKNDDEKADKTGLSRLFIGRPLEELLNDRLLHLVRYRNGMGFPWLGAEEFFDDHQGRNLENDAPDPKYWAPEDLKPTIATQDHLKGSEKQKSFPLIAMQYALRHLVRCTEFCLVCHRKVEADFEALKPYVCDKPLCLYQYMSLGFGPSIEHEVITQPHVVDLLVSFCYASAAARRLRYLPTGMALMVPDPQVMSKFSDLCGSMTGFPSYRPPAVAFSRGSSSAKASVTSGAEGTTYKAKLDRQKMELRFPTSGGKVPLHVGSWITIGVHSVKEDLLHCRVIEVMYPTIRLSNPIVPLSEASGGSTGHGQRQAGHLSAVNSANLPKNPTPPAVTPVASHESFISSYVDTEFVIYDNNFDDLDDNGKYATICMLLGTLPSVSDMKNFLLSRGGQEANLRLWSDRLTPAALGLLRWIIASNRSCIVQVDSLEGVSRKSEERVSGMPGWMQFRFAQGAPDKEQRFVTSIKKTTAGAKHPTMFAWHGSPLHNWHGIVREGLHFEHTAHGRAYGNGVYHALDCQTSLGYSGGMYGDYSRGGDSYRWSPGQWPYSQLLITQALALNEIVNAPSQFVSKNPHLVVAQLDWIQSRYLFVKCNVQGWQMPEVKPTQTYDQDPNYHPKGVSHSDLILPLTAVSKARRPKTTESVKSGNKKVKMSKIGSVEEDPIVLSEETDIEDLAIFFSDKEEQQPELSQSKGKLPVGQCKSSKKDPPKIDFTVGQLDASSLQLLDPPSYATSMATKALQRELQATLKIQGSHPLHELGWYIDANLISNVYQWIVELHSFEAHLPIAKDMKQKGIKSVVMEIRFGASYPMSPPFVRVIRPRFLSFMQGGGGHITAGGALCMELLTNSGWSAVSNIESVLLQVRLAMSSTDPKPARLEHGPLRDYGVGEAVEAYIRACHAHGWEVPADFRSNYAGGSAGFDMLSR